MATSPDTTAPSVLRFYPRTGSVVTGDVQFQVVFSEPVSGFTAGDITVRGGTVTALAGADATWTFTVRPVAGSSGTLTVSLAAGAVTDTAGNASLATGPIALPYDTRTGGSMMTGTSVGDVLTLAEGSAAAVLSGLEGGDLLVGNAADNLLLGGLGDDNFRPGAGNDSVSGGEQRALAWFVTSAGDYDTLDYTGVSDSGITVVLAERKVSGGAQVGTDWFWGIERILGTAGADTFTGRLPGGLVDPQHWIQVVGWGGNDTFSQALSPWEVWASGMTVQYWWSSTGVHAVFDGAHGTVAYGSGATAGVDSLDRITSLGDTYHDDSFDLRNYGVDNYGARFNSVTLSGGSDVVLGNGDTQVSFALSGTQAGGTGAKVDLASGTATLAGLVGPGNTAFGTILLSGVDSVVATRLADTLLGGAHDDQESFRGEGGNDFIDGRGGHDRADYWSATAGITVQLAAGIVTGDASVGTDTLRHVEAARGSLYADVYDARGFGAASTNAGDIGRDGMNNAFEGRGGNDVVYGNGATSVEYYTSPLAVRVDLAKGFSDALNAADLGTPAYQALGRDTFTGGVYRVRGSLLGDLLTGGGSGISSIASHYELFDPQAGDDTIDGGGGWDVVSYFGAPGPVHADLALGSGQVDDGTGARDTLTGVEHLIGGAHDDVLLGRDDQAGLQNGTETLDGRGGDNVIVGRGGFDRVSYWDGSKGVLVVLDAGFTVETRTIDGQSIGFRGAAENNWGGFDLLSGVEGVSGSVFGDRIYGSPDDNRFEGNAGDDLIDGGAGSDWAEYHNAPAGVRVDLGRRVAFEDGFGGTDRLESIENLRGSDYADTLTGDGGDNQLQGRDGNDTLAGGAGTDVAVYRGNRADYAITEVAPGAWVVQDKRAAAAFDAASGAWTNNDGTDRLEGIEVLRFADGDMALDGSGGTTGLLGGIAYHWKSHEMLTGTTVNVAGGASAPTGSPLSLRVVSVDASGTLSAEVWVKSSVAVGNLQVELGFDTGRAATFEANAGVLPSGWDPLTDTSTAGTFLYGAFGMTALAAGEYRLGTIRLAAPAQETGLQELALVGGEAGDAAATPYAVTLAATAAGASGSWSITGVDYGNYTLSATRATTDSASAITSADALAALRIAVGSNPNPDPDGTGPQSAPAVSPYQVMAADVNADGRVTSADALAILRMAVKQPTALAREWLFVEETRDFWDETANGGAGGFSLTRLKAGWDRSIAVTVDGTGSVNLVGVLKGDVNGSWAAPAGTPDLDVTQPGYFTALAQVVGVPLDQWAA